MKCRNVPKSGGMEVGVGLIGLGNVGLGTLEVLAGNAQSIEAKLGFPLQLKAVCSRTVHEKTLRDFTDGIVRATNWREVVSNPGIDVIVELIGGLGTASHVIEEALLARKSVVTANKELIALRGAELWDLANQNGVHLAMEASVAGGIPIHSVLREGIAGDRVTELYGILNGTSNFILTEIEKSNAAFDSVVAEAQQLGYAEADPSADVDGLDARSKLAILAALAFGEKITPADIFVEGIRRISPMDFQYAHKLGHTIRLICGARQTPDGLILSVRPALIGSQTIIAGVQGAYNAVWVKGRYGEDTFYYGRGAGPLPTGVAVVSDLMRVAREIRHGRPERVSPFAHERLGEFKPLSVTSEKCAYYLRFRVDDRPGIIAALAGILAEQRISLEAVLQLPSDSKHDLPFVITVEPTYEHAVREAVQKMSTLEFLREPPLALPMEPPL